MQNLQLANSRIQQKLQEMEKVQGQRAMMRGILILLLGAILIKEIKSWLSGNSLFLIWGHGALVLGLNYYFKHQSIQAAREDLQSYWQLIELINNEGELSPREKEIRSLAIGTICLDYINSLSSGQLKDAQISRLATAIESGIMHQRDQAEQSVEDFSVTFPSGSSSAAKYTALVLLIEQLYAAPSAQAPQI